MDDTKDREYRPLGRPISPKLGPIQEEPNFSFLDQELIERSEGRFIPPHWPWPLGK